MANLTRTVNTTTELILFGATFDDETLTSAGADTWVAGTLLGRVTASGKLTAYTSAAVDGSQVPLAVLAEDVEFAGAGDKPSRVIIEGHLRRGQLIAHGVGAITKPESDLLRSYSILSSVTNDLSELDN